MRRRIFAHPNAISKKFILSPLRDCTFSHSLGHVRHFALQKCSEP